MNEMSTVERPKRLARDNYFFRQYWIFRAGTSPVSRQPSKAFEGLLGLAGAQIGKRQRRAGAPSGPSRTVDRFHCRIVGAAATGERAAWNPARLTWHCNVAHW